MWPEARWCGPDGLVHIIGSHSGLIRTECLTVIRRTWNHDDRFQEVEGTVDPATCLECIFHAVETVRAMGVISLPWDGTPIFTT
jgi:hypothetical protein